MLLVYGIIISIVVGLIRKGNIRGLAELGIRRVELIFVAFLIEASTGAIPRIVPGADQRLLWLWVTIEYLFLFLFIWYNRNRKEILVLGIGILLNFAVIMANQGSMPISQDILKIPSLAEKFQSIVSGGLSEYHLMTESTILWFLGDIFYVPILDPGFMSIGDIIIAIGVFLLIQTAMLSYRKKEEV